MKVTLCLIYLLVCIVMNLSHLAVESLLEFLCILHVHPALLSALYWISPSLYYLDCEICAL